MVGWHHRLDTHEFGWTLGVGDGQGGLARCDSWGHKESDTTEQLNRTEPESMAYHAESHIRLGWFSDCPVDRTFMSVPV